MAGLSGAARGEPGPAAPAAGAEAVAGIPAPGMAQDGAECTGRAEAGAPGRAAGPAVLGDVAVPHGRVAADADAGWSEVPAARVRVEPEPVHALAGAADRAESGGGSYGQEPDPVVCVPAPAGSHDETAPTGVATLRLQALDGGGEPPAPQGRARPAESGLPVADGPAHRYGEAWPPGPQPGQGPGPGAGAGAGGPRPAAAP
ncbi:hypothetical protein ACFXA3_09885, partial [Streptomyces sp. NPDC059456]